MKRDERLRVIEEIISGRNISSQEQLLHIMEGLGIKCTQATLSRDLRRIGVGRISDGDATPYYRVVRGVQAGGESAAGIYHKAIVSLVWARELLIMKTYPGFAAGVASTIDGAGKKCIAGTVAGDDTIIIIPEDGYSRGEVMTQLGEVFPGIDKLRRS